MRRFLLYLLSLSIVLLSGCGGGGGSSSALQTIEDEPQATSSVPLLLIRVQYNDISFTHDAATWSNKIFGNHQHALNHYYHEVSHGNFVFTRVAETEGIQDDGVITITLDRSHPDSGYSELIHTDLTDALVTANAFMDFSQYDVDHNNRISLDELQIMYIIAGGEDAYGYTTLPSVWAHSSCIDTQTSPAVPPTADGVTLLDCNAWGTYSLFGERHDDYRIPQSTHDATVGIIAHELGHAAFLLPDLYDTVDAGSYGIGLFGLMGYGSWGATASDTVSDLYGNTPTHFCGWSKIENGWLAPQTLNSVTAHTVSLTESTAPTFNVVKLPVSSSEYFLLENRNNSGYDAGLYSLYGTFDGGIAIWHIDENIINANYSSNTVNNDEAHRGVDLEEANAANLDNGGLGHEANLYYLGNKTEFSPFTSPDSSSYSGTPSGIIVENISQRGSVMQATVTN